MTHLIPSNRVLCLCPKSQEQMETCIIPKDPVWLDAEHLRLHTAFLNGLASHVIR